MAGPAWQLLTKIACDRRPATGHRTRMYSYQAVFYTCVLNISVFYICVCPPKNKFSIRCLPPRFRSPGETVRAKKFLAKFPSIWYKKLFAGPKSSNFIDESPRWYRFSSFFFEVPSQISKSSNFVDEILSLVSPQQVFFVRLLQRPQNRQILLTNPPVGAVSAPFF